MLAELRGRRVLLLQGPSGLFFRRLAVDLERAGATTLRVTMNAGDALLHAGMPSVAFRRPMSEWPEFLDDLLAARSIDAIVLFGDMRPLHVVARERASARGVDIWVLEEGYLRPNHITVERGGVNGNSRMPRDPEFYRAYARRRGSAGDTESIIPVGEVFPVAAWWSTVHAMAATIAGFLYPHYVHHRELNCWKHTFYWLRGGFRRLWHAPGDARALARIGGELAGRYFLVPLQVATDSQLRHSPFADVPSFIASTIASFAKHARPSDHLVVKHHPLDRPYSDYSRLLDQLAAAHGITDRLHYVRDLDIETLIATARGTVLINSTVGMTSLCAGVPVMALGCAVYALEGLTFTGELAEFWQTPGEVDRELCCGLREWMLRHNQANGSVWRPLPAVASATGVKWPC